jgi:hypothetical protein
MSEQKLVDLQAANHEQLIRLSQTLNELFDQLAPVLYPDESTECASKNPPPERCSPAVESTRDAMEYIMDLNAQTQRILNRLEL